MDETRSSKLTPELLTECAEWVWEQLQEEGVYIAGEVVDLILAVERELGIQVDAPTASAPRIERELIARGVSGNPNPIGEDVIRTVLEWEDEFLGFAGIARADA